MGGVGKKVISNSNLDVRNMFAGSQICLFQYTISLSQTSPQLPLQVC
jgi:hypothetical protein